MKHAVSLNGLAQLEELSPTLIKELSESGFEGVSISPRLMLNLTNSTRRNLSAAVADYGMGVALHGSFDTSIKDLIDLAKLIGPQLENITFDPVLGWTSAGLLYKIESMGPYLIELDHVAKAHGFLYGVEDFPETPFALKMYQENLSLLLESDRFGILIDIGHFNESVHNYGYYKGISPEEHFAQLPLRLLEVHLSDNNGKEDQHLPLGMGIIDFASVARGIRKIGFKGFSTIEIEPRKECKNSIADAKQDIIQSYLYWKDLYRNNME